MADDKIDIPEIPEPSVLEVGHIRRFSTGNVGALNSIRSRYLRASLGSCHDLCKFGIRNAAETDARSPRFKKSTMRGECQGLETVQETETETLVGRNMQVTLNLKPSLDSESQRLDDPAIVTREVSSISKQVTLSSNNASLALEEIDVSLKHAGSSKLKTVQSKTPSVPTSGSLKSTRNSDIRKMKEMGARSMNSAVVGDSRRKSEVGKNNELTTSESGEHKVSVPPSVASAPKRSVKKSSTTNAKSSRNPTGISNMKNQTIARKSKPEQTSSVDVPEKTLYIIESSVKNRKVELAQLSPSSSSSLEDKNLKLSRSSPPVEKKNLRHTQNGTPATRSIPSLASSSEKKGSRRTQYGSHVAQSPPSLLSAPRSGRGGASSKQNETETNRQKVHLKGTPASRLPPSLTSSSDKKGLRGTQYGTPSLTSSSEKKVLRRTQYRTPVARSTPSSLSASSSPNSGRSRAPSQHDENEVDSQRLNLKVENKSRGRNSGVSSSPKDKDSDAQKLKFRRGKVIEFQSEVITPRRLKFRRRILVDNITGKVDAGRRSFGKKEDYESKVGFDGNHGILSNLSKKAFLKHQDVARKKSAKTLFNNVIEETASKLVETRKSKVKALVGAFETVISLQEKQRPRTTSL